MRNPAPRNVFEIAGEELVLDFNQGALEYLLQVNPELGLAMMGAGSQPPRVKRKDESQESYDLEMAPFYKELATNRTKLLFGNISLIAVAMMQTENPAVLIPSVEDLKRLPIDKSAVLFTKVLDILNDKQPKPEDVPAEVESGEVSEAPVADPTLA